MGEEENISYNTFLAKKLKKKNYQPLEPLDKVEPPKKTYSTFDFFAQNNAPKPTHQKLIPTLKEMYDTERKKELEQEKERKELEKKLKEEQEKKEKEEQEHSINTIYKYSYKHKYHLDVRKIIFSKTRMKFPTPPMRRANRRNDLEQAEKIMINLLNNSTIDNTSFENEEKDFGIIKRFPTNKEFLVFSKDNYYIIYNIRTGEKIRTQKSNDIYGFQGLLTLSRERILTVGADFLRIYHYNLTKRQLKYIEPNNNYPTYEATIYVRQMTSYYAVICKRSACYLFNLEKYCSDKIIYLKSIIILLNIRNSFKNIKKTDINLAEDYFSNCKVLSKREFGLCYRSFIFLVCVPEGGIFTYFDVSNSTNIMDCSKKYMKRMNVFLDMKQPMKKYYLIWPENASSIKVYSKQEKKIHPKRERYTIPYSNCLNPDEAERHSLLVINTKEEIIKYEKNIYLNPGQRIYNVKQCSNFEVIIITKDNDMLIFNFICNTFITTIKYARVILDNELYFLKRVGKDLFLVNLRSGMLGLIGIKTGKILKKFNVDFKLVNSADICLVPREEENEIRYHKNILILNSYDIFCLEL